MDEYDPWDVSGERFYAKLEEYLCKRLQKYPEWRATLDVIIESEKKRASLSHEEAYEQARAVYVKLQNTPPCPICEIWRETSQLSMTCPLCGARTGRKEYTPPLVVIERMIEDLDAS